MSMSNLFTDVNVYDWRIRQFFEQTNVMQNKCQYNISFLINEHNPLPRFFIFGNFTIGGKSSVENAICFRHFQIFI